ncbi:Hypothetical protein CINCED_3A000592 [Cinara cedri]|uniref:Uncharacterized protein n=1 Tax=Cinara cedri TaxID=506608 RepID=A0A5E4N097_9HEMI|nr:Hypothetical protein CINCED_3A000592 [Cinara cedri]
MENIMKEFHENRYESSAKVTLEKMERLIDEYLKRKIKLNLRCDHYECTVSNFVFKKIIDIANASSVMRITPTTRSRYKDNGEEAMDEWEEGLEPLFNIVNKLLSSGAKIESDFYNNSMISEVMWGNDEPIFTERKKIKEELKSIAYEGLVNKNEQVQGDDLTGEVDNNLVLFRWPKNSIVEVAKVMNSKVNENFSIESSILQIGKSIIRVESIGRKRNYTDVLGGGIEMSFTTEVGKISIHLCPSDEGNNIIEVKLDGESKEKFDKLKDQSSLGASCLLGGKSVLQAIKDKGFERNGGIFIELAETIKQSDFVVKESGVPSTLMRSVDSLDQLQRMKASKEILIASKCGESKKVSNVKYQVLAATPTATIGSRPGVTQRNSTGNLTKVLTPKVPNISASLTNLNEVINSFSQNSLSEDVFNHPTVKRNLDILSNRTATRSNSVSSLASNSSHFSAISTFSDIDDSIASKSSSFSDLSDSDSGRGASIPSTPERMIISSDDLIKTRSQLKKVNYQEKVGKQQPSTFMSGQEPIQVTKSLQTSI